MTHPEQGAFISLTLTVLVVCRYCMLYVIA